MFFKQFSAYPQFTDTQSKLKMGDGIQSENVFLIGKGGREGVKELLVYFISVSFI